MTSWQWLGPVAATLQFLLCRFPVRCAVAWVSITASLAMPLATAQQADRLPNVHYLNDARQPPGSIAASQVARGTPGVGMFQPVSLQGPAGLQIALVQDGQFLPLLDAPVTTGMLVGSVYRFQVANIPLRPGIELFPTIEIIDHVRAPANRAHRFPIPVVLTRDDLEMALNGALVTRVIYLEDNSIADPVAADTAMQNVTTVGPEENALQVADQLGRPVAILRIGSRFPPSNGDLHSFVFGSPPWIPLPPLPNREQLIASGQWPLDADAATSPSDNTEPLSAEPVERIPMASQVADTSGDTCCLPCAPDQQPRSLPVDPHAYIFDGGDGSPQAEIREDWTAVGVAPTETIAFYDSVTGRVCVTTTNRVAIYAPRFAAIRQVSGAIMTAGARGPERLLSPLAAGRLTDTSMAGSVMQPTSLHGQQQVGLIDALEESKFGARMDQILPLKRMSDARFAIEGFDITATGRITDQEIAVLGKIVQNAHAWWSPESLQVYLNGLGTALATKSRRPKEVLHYETKDHCSLRVVKGASSSVALPGDVIRFTLRFDNHGTKPIGNVVLVDSLSGRLEYIDGSQQASIPLQFSKEINEAGSHLLRWELERPLKPYEGGVITFDCKVR